MTNRPSMGRSRTGGGVVALLKQMEASGKAKKAGGRQAKTKEKPGLASVITLLLVAFIVAGFLIGWKVAIIIATVVAVSAAYSWRTKYASKALRAGQPMPALRGLPKAAWGEAKVARQVTDAWPHIAKEFELTTKRLGAAPPPLKDVTVTIDGDVAAKIHTGLVPVDQYYAKTKEIAQGVRCKEVRIKRLGPQTLSIKFFYTDPLERTLMVSDLPMSGPNEITFGVNEEGEPATIPAMTSCLVIGETRSGKSNLGWAVLADAIRKGWPTRLYISDPAGTEFSRIQEMAAAKKTTIDVAGYETTDPVKTLAMVNRMIEDMNSRAPILARTKKRKIEQFTKEAPFTVLMMDEMLRMSDVIGKGSTGPVGHIVTGGAKYGCIVIGSAQVAQKVALTTLRDAFPNRLLLRVSEHELIAATLGEDATNWAFAKDIPKTTPGVGYYTSNAGDKMKFRVVLVRDEDADLIAQGLLPEGMKPQVVAEDQRPYEVYAHFGTDGDSLYVGKTNDYERRMVEHRRDFENGKPGHEWVGLYDPRRTKHRYLDDQGNEMTATSVLVQEKKDIKRYKPIYNDTHNHDNPRMGFHWTPAEAEPEPKPKRSLRQVPPLTEVPAPALPTNVTDIKSRHRPPPPPAPVKRRQPPPPTRKAV